MVPICGVGRPWVTRYNSGTLRHYHMYQIQRRFHESIFPYQMRAFYDVDRLNAVQPREIPEQCERSGCLLSPAI